MKRLLSIAAVLSLMAGLMSPTLLGIASAATAKSSEQSLDSSVQTVAQSYATASPLQQGLIVQLDNKNKKAVLAATYKDSQNMLGVVVAPNAAPVSLSSNTDKQNAYVVTSGQYKVLVSTQNGSIKQGDFVSVSAISGIGMKADTKQASVLGRAISDFDGKTDVISTTKLKQTDGQEVNTSIGAVTVDVNVAPNKQRDLSTDGVPPAIQSIAIALTGKPVSATQVYISAAILIVGLCVVASLLYGGIQTGMTAIGRNPLARSSIIRNMVQVIITAVLILFGCLIAVYLILKL